MNPIVIALAITLTFGFESILYGLDEFSPGEFPDMRSRTPQVDTGACGGAGNWWGEIVDGAKCLAATVAQFGANIVGFVVWVASVVGYVAVFLGNLGTLNVSGAHWLGRVLMGLSISGSLGWVIATFTRGVKS